MKQEGEKMGNEAYAAIREDLATLRSDIASISQSMDWVKGEFTRMSDKHDERLRQLELFRVKYETQINSLSHTFLTVEDNKRAVANLRKFLWAIATTAGGALIITVANLLVQNGAQL